MTVRETFTKLLNLFFFHFSMSLSVKHLITPILKKDCTDSYFFGIHFSSG
jgi:hypothetical protein